MSRWLLQSVGRGHGGGLGGVEARGYTSLSGRGVRMLWTEPIDGRIGLAGVHGGGAVCARHEPGEGLSRKVFNERKGGGSGGKRLGVLEIKTAGEAGPRLTARRGLQCRGIAVGGRKRLRWGEVLGA